MARARQQENAGKGESRTLAILSDRFWVLERNVDYEGADFLVQIPAVSFDELKERKAKIEVFGIVQSKYFENSNQVKIAKEYVEDKAGNVRTDFFAILHTTNESGDDDNYFFTAREIQKQFYLSKDEEHYCFSITKDRNYSANCNIKKTDILEAIAKGMESTESERNMDLVKIVYVRLPSVTQTELGSVTQTVQGPIVVTDIYNKFRDTVISGTYLGSNIDSEYDPVSCTTRPKPRCL